MLKYCSVLYEQYENLYYANNYAKAENWYNYIFTFLFWQLQRSPTTTSLTYQNRNNYIFFILKQYFTSTYKWSVVPISYIYFFSSHWIYGHYKHASFDYNFCLHLTASLFFILTIVVPSHIFDFPTRCAAVVCIY